MSDNIIDTATMDRPERSLIRDADDYTFEKEVIERSLDVPVLVDCWAEWCGPCKALTPILESLTQQYRGRFELVKVDIDQAQRVAMALRIQSVPFLILFMGGRPVDALVGNQSESELRAFLDRHLPPVEGDPLEEGMTALKEGDYSRAIEVLQRAMREEPDRSEPRLALAKATLAIGDLDAAAQLLDSIPSQDPLAADASRLRALFSLVELRGDQADLERRLAQDQRDVDAWYRSAVNAALAGDFSEACHALLKVVEIDRSYRDDAGRQTLLLIFEVLGGEGELVSRCRRQLASLLF
jgi:putative thioredoxin